MGVAVHHEGQVRGNVGVNKTWRHRKCFRISECFDYIKPQSSEREMIGCHNVIPVSFGTQTYGSNTQDTTNSRWNVCQVTAQPKRPSFRLSFHSAKHMASGRPRQVSSYPKTDTVVMLGKVGSAYTCWVEHLRRCVSGCILRVTQDTAVLRFLACKQQVCVWTAKRAAMGKRYG